MKMLNMDGTPTEKGAKLLRPFQYCLDTIFELSYVKSMTENQKRMLGGWLSKMVGDTVSKNI